MGRGRRGRIRDRVLLAHHLVIGWFESVQGVAGPVTDLGYGALVGIILTFGLLTQLLAPERTIAGMQQAALVIRALLVGSGLARDAQM